MSGTKIGDKITRELSGIKVSHRFRNRVIDNNTVNERKNRDRR
jgi:hypothetical protein